MTTMRWTSQDVELLFPDNNGKRYEIVNGELYVSKQPHWHHQHICLRLGGLLDAWCMQTDAGEAIAAPGLIFAEDNDVAPDIVWISRERLEAALQPDGRLHAAPELVVEVLSPGITDEHRDCEAKLIPMCVQSGNIAVRDAHGNVSTLNAHWYQALCTTRCLRILDCELARAPH